MLWHNYVYLKLSKISDYLISLNGYKEYWFIAILNKNNKQKWILDILDYLDASDNNKRVETYTSLKFLKKGSKLKVYNFFFLNSNVNLPVFARKRKLLKFIKSNILLRFLIPVANIYNYMFSLKLKKLFFKRFLYWYYYITRNDKTKSNINNIINYIKLYVYYIQVINFLIYKFNIKLIKAKKQVKFWKFYLGNTKLKLQKFFEKMFLLANLQDEFTAKIDKLKTLYKNYINYSNIITVNYNTFSFKLKKIKKKYIKKNKKNIYLEKFFNLAFFINIMFVKFVLCLFMNWLNQFNLFNDINSTSYYYNYKTNFIIKLNICKHFLYRRRFKKLSFLGYFKNSKLLLFFNKTK